MKNQLHPKLVKLEQSFQPSGLTRMESPLLAQKQIELWVKRDDLIHPVISGNKWRKLKYILDYVLTHDFKTIVSMGGAYSNHLHALAFVGKQLGLRTIGYIRGERPAQLNPTIRDVLEWGMELRFVSRTTYKNLRQLTQVQAEDAVKIAKHHYWLPEGGATELALAGVAEIDAEIPRQFDSLCVPCGTGTTLAGLVAGANADRQIHGFAALKGADFLLADVQRLLTHKNQEMSDWFIHLDYHFGGFAKCKPELKKFIIDFKEYSQIEIEPVYSGKMFFGLFDLIRKNRFKPGAKILAIHTGGLQGNRKRKTIKTDPSAWKGAGY